MVLDARDPAAIAVGSLLSYVPRLLRSWPDDTLHRDIEGTLVSADLSGFTRLSERLAALGREGAEELTTLLNGCFTRMIAEIERFGGDVLKFGGDALLILYQGARHTERACFTTIVMRDLVAEPLTTSTGTRVRLRISQGMHAGSFSLFVLDGNHRELMVTGPGVTETVECEGTANAGQILLSAAAVANVDRSWLGRDVDGRRLLRRIVVLEEPVDLESGQTSAVDVTPFVPAAQREQIEVGAPAEHRRVAIGFIKFSHTDGVLARLGAGDFASRLQRLAGAVARAERDFGVHWLASDVYPDGGKVILTAGAPLTLGDDEERVLRAARQILDEIDDLDLRIGVNAGPVFVGDLGSPDRRAFTVMGDAVNLAARLMQKADSGQLIASDATLERSPTRFEVTELEPFFVKGKTVPISASIVGAVQTKREQIGRLDLIGREKELQSLLDAASSARVGNGRVIEIVGEPGAGKSRLLEELHRREPEFRTFTAQCGQYARSSPYFALRAMLRSIAGIHIDASPEEAAEALVDFVGRIAPEVEPWLPLLAIPFEAEIPLTPAVDQIAPQFRRSRTHTAVADLVTAVMTTPTLLLIEDLHWIDDASRDLVGEILSHVADHAWLMVLTRRPGLAQLDVAEMQTIELQPLDGEAALELVLAAAGTDSGLRPADWDRLVARAGGNPLFAIELADAARQHGSADALADSVESLVTSKIDTLPARDRLLLREASVLGAVVDVDLLAEALEDDGILDPVRWQPLEDFVVHDAPVMRFRHAIHQNVAYEGLSYRRRRDMHARAARAIRHRFADQADSMASLLSTHYYRAGDNGAAWEFSVKAGDEARGKFANVEAGEFYTRALDAARTLSSVDAAAVATVAESLGDVRDLTTQYQEARQAYAVARRHLPPGSPHAAELLRKDGRMCEREGRYTQALRAYSRALKTIDRSADSATDAIRAEIFASYGSARYWQGRGREAVEWARRAIDAAEKAGDQPALAHALRLIEVCLEELGDAERLQYRGRALPIYETLDDQVGLADELTNLGVFAATEGAFDDAIEYFERARRARERAGDVLGEAVAINNAGEVLLLLGRAEEARPFFDQALRIVRSTKHPVGTVWVLGNLGSAEAATGSYERGLEILDEAISIADGSHAVFLANEMRVRRLEALTLAGRNREALTLADELALLTESALGANFIAMVARLRGWLRLRDGDTDGAAACIDDAIERLGSSESIERGLALRGRAEIRRRLGDAGGAAEDDQRANELFEKLGLVSEPPLL
jgi:class 3 adenylate cyclase/tetratricopeptide (TPR) repeat protein